jgi:hypothetical protein
VQRWGLTTLVHCLNSFKQSTLKTNIYSHSSVSFAVPVLVCVPGRTTYIHFPIGVLLLAEKLLVPVSGGSERGTPLSRQTKGLVVSRSFFILVWVFLPTDF